MKDHIQFGLNKNELENNEKLKTIPACYYCVVRASNPAIQYAKEYGESLSYDKQSKYNFEAREIAYKSALATEKRKLSKLSDFVDGSGILDKSDTK